MQRFNKQLKHILHEKQFQYIYVPSINNDSRYTIIFITIHYDINIS